MHKKVISIKLFRKNRLAAGLLLGAVAGLIDIIPMILQNLTWDANLSAFSMWVIVGFLIASVKIDLAPVWKGILLSLVVFIPTGFLIGWKDPFSLIPILAMTIILGSMVGYAIDRVCGSNA